MTVSVHEKYDILVEKFDVLLKEFVELKKIKDEYEAALVAITECMINYDNVREKTPTIVIASNIQLAISTLKKHQKRK